MMVILQSMCKSGLHYHIAMLTVSHKQRQSWSLLKRDNRKGFEWIEQRGCEFKVVRRDGNRVYLKIIGQHTQPNNTSDKTL